MRPMMRWAVVGCVVATAAPLSGQTFRARSDLVVLHVNVFDGKSDAVPELTKDVFRVFEDGQPQEIAFFSSDDVPVSVGLVIDNSSSMITKHPLVVAGSMAFANSSHPEDELFVVPFTETVRFGLPAHIPFTPNRSLLRATLLRLTAGGKTALYDAVIAALDHLQAAQHQKHVLVVLSDGEDNASRHREKDMFDRAVRSDAIIYTVSVDNTRIGGSGDEGVLRKLARLTGGAAYFPRSEGEVVTHFTEIAENIRRGYSIGYVPTNTARDGGYRRVKVTVRAPGRGKMNVQCRDGYTAPRASSTL